MTNTSSQLSEIPDLPSQGDLTTTDTVNIVFLHGWGMNSGVFTRLISSLEEQLQEHFTISQEGNDRAYPFAISCIDLPGHGDNEQQMIKNHCSSLNWSLDCIADAVAEKIPPNSILVGWSLGGLVAQKLAIKHNPNIAAVITIASTPKFQMDDSWPGIKPELLSLFTDQLKLNHHKTLSRFIAIQMMGVANAKALIKEISLAIEVKPAPNKEALAAGLKILQTADLRTALSEIKVPTLRLYGRLDSLVPHAAIQLIQNLHPQSEHIVFKHASHAPFLTDAVVFAEHLLPFIRKVVKKTNKNNG